MLAEVVDRALEHAQMLTDMVLVELAKARVETEVSRLADLIIPPGVVTEVEERPDDWPRIHTVADQAGW